MASKREQVLQALYERLRTGLPGVDVARNRSKAQKIGAGGDVIQRDGDPGEPEISMSPLSYFYEHQIPLEVAWPTDDTAELDALCGQIGALIIADRTLGGLCNWLEASPARTDPIETYGAPAASWADIIVAASYSTPDPLN